jgi:hypothetical protein
VLFQFRVEEAPEARNDVQSLRASFFVLAENKFEVPNRKICCGQNGAKRNEALVNSCCNTLNTENKARTNNTVFSGRGAVL